MLKLQYRNIDFLQIAITPSHFCAIISKFTVTSTQNKQQNLYATKAFCSFNKNILIRQKKVCFLLPARKK